VVGRTLSEVNLGVAARGNDVSIALEEVRDTIATTARTGDAKHGETVAVVRWCEFSATPGIGVGLNHADMHVSSWKVLKSQGAK
jgi:hypothetical protein